MQPLAPDSWLFEAKDLERIEGNRQVNDAAIDTYVASRVLSQLQGTPGAAYWSR